MRPQKYWKIELYYLHLVLDICIISRRWIDFRLYYYIDRSNGSSTIWLFFESQYFVWRRLKPLLIVEVDQFLVTWRTVDRLLLSMRAYFSRWAKKSWLPKRLWKSTEIYVQNWTYVRNTREELAFLIWNWAKEQKTISNCDWSVQCCLEPFQWPLYILSCISSINTHCTHKVTLQKYGHLFVGLFWKTEGGIWKTTK